MTHPSSGAWCDVLFPFAAARFTHTLHTTALIQIRLGHFPVAATQQLWAGIMCAAPTRTATQPRFECSFDRVQINANYDKPKYFEP